MKLIPNKRQLQWLSAEDQAFWRGYFKGIGSASIEAERKFKQRPFDAHIGDALNGMGIYQKHHLSKGLRTGDRAAIYEGLKGLTTGRKQELLKDMKNILRLMRSGNVVSQGGK